MIGLPEGKRQLLKKNGEPGGTRTRDHRIKSAMLYQLSYRPIDYSQGISKLGAAFGVRHGLLGLFPTPA